MFVTLGVEVARVWRRAGDGTVRWLLGMVQATALGVPAVAVALLLALGNWAPAAQRQPDRWYPATEQERGTPEERLIRRLEAEYLRDQMYARGEGS